MNKVHVRSFGLDFARALAICLVVVSHFGHVSFGKLGFWGVELFFGLSGFLIGQILWRNFSATNDWNSKQIFNFWSRRWWRTLPNYYLFFLINILLCFVNAQNLPPLSRLSVFLWFGQNLASFYWGFYVIAWSLCIEEWFYLLFPIVLFTFSKLKLQHKSSFIFTLMFFFIGSMVMRYILINNGSGDALRTITFARLDSIATGVAVSFILAIFNPSVKWKYIACFVGLLFVVSPALVAYYTHKPFDDLIQNPIILLVVPLGFSLTLPALNLMSPPIVGQKIITSVITNLSLWSYSLYLSHLAVMWEVYYIMDKYRSSAFVNLLSKIAGLAITIVISVLLFNYFEKPLTEKRPAEIKLNKPE